MALNKKKKKKKKKRNNGITCFFILVFAVIVFFYFRQGRTDEAPESSRIIDPEKPMIALTIDDGPSTLWSPRILDCLEANGAVATFFEVGKNVEAMPEISKRAFDLGCEIGSHTYSHLNLPSASEADLNADREKCIKVFSDALGNIPTLMRPPGGALSSSVKSYYNVPFIGWSLDTEDWRTRNAESTVECIRSCSDLNRQVVLMHSIYESTAEAVEVIVPWLLDQGYQLVTVSELLEYGYGVKPQNGTYYTVDFFLYGAEPN